MIEGILERVLRETNDARLVSVNERRKTARLYSTL